MDQVPESEQVECAGCYTAFTGVFELAEEDRDLRRGSDEQGD